jgi:hypothetical protein
MNLFGVPKMSQANSEYRASRADRCPSIFSLRSQTSIKSASEQTFSAAC